VDRLREANSYAAAHGLPPFRFLQNQWSLAHPNWPNNSIGDVRFLDEPDEAPLAELDVIAAPWSPNAAGWFAGKNAWGGDYENPGNHAARAQAQEAAARLGLPLSTVALAWLLHRGVPVSPILGTGSLEHLDEAIAAFSVPAHETIGLRIA
jgi:aryl-alcohol dehydrogenase-like predicted oxidoreductase